MNVGHFKCTINLGNDGMQDEEDVAMALSGVVMSMSNLKRTGGLIRDINGNTVGIWELDVNEDDEI